MSNIPIGPTFNIAIPVSPQTISLHRDDGQQFGIDDLVEFKDNPGAVWSILGIRDSLTVVLESEDKTNRTFADIGELYKYDEEHAKELKELENI